jgi:hypothetical protein
MSKKARCAVKTILLKFQLKEEACDRVTPL